MVKSSINAKSPFLYLANDYLRIVLVVVLMVSLVAFTLTKLLPFGANSTYLGNVYKVGVFASFILGLICYSLSLGKTRRGLRKIEIPSASDAWLILMPMLPITNFLVLNSESASLHDVFYVGAMSVLLVVAVGFVIPVIFSLFAPLYVLIIAGLAMVYSVFNTSVLTANPSQVLFGSFTLTQGFYFALMLIIIGFLYRTKPKYAYGFSVLIFLIGLSESTYKVFTASDTIAISQKEDADISSLEVLVRPNIYILIYDSYPNNETLLNYGYDNSDQLKYLIENDFRIVEGSYSVGSSSLASTARLLNFSHDLPGYIRNYTAGDARSLSFLRQHGYQTVSVFPTPFFFLNTNPTWDNYYPEGVSGFVGAALFSSILEGSFRHNAFERNFNDFTYDRNKFLEEKRNYMGRSVVGPRLLYTHSNLPDHSQNSGVCLPDETELFFGRLNEANREMKADLDKIIQSDPDSIVFILGDHGPYLTKDCYTLEGYKDSDIDSLDLQDRFGTFMAVRWPNGSEFGSEFNLQLMQDVFPSILAYLSAGNRDDFKRLTIPRKTFGLGDSVFIEDGIIVGGKDAGSPLFRNRSYLVDR